MNADESSKACAATSYSGATNLAIMDSQPATTSKQSIGPAAITNVNHSNNDGDVIKLAQSPHKATTTSVLPSINPVEGNLSQNSSGAKRIIRKVMVIDPKKLQQAGLDRKLAEAIGRQKLKAMSKEQNKNTQNSESSKLKMPFGSNIQSTITPTSSAATLSVVSTISSPTVKTVSEDTFSTFKAAPATPVTIKALPIVKNSETVKNILVKSPIEVTACSEGTASDKNTTPEKGVSNTCAPERKVFVTPKITITRPGEEILPLRIIPEHRLENVKYILQCKILKRQQLSAQTQPTMPAQMATQTLHSPNASTSLPSPSHNQRLLIAPKVETKEDERISSKPLAPKKPSPAKTPQDVARALDFSSEVATCNSATATAAAPSDKKVTNDGASCSLRTSLYTSKSSLAKTETVGPRAIDVARLIARIGTVTMRKDLTHSNTTSKNSKRTPVVIPKATIKCQNRSAEMKEKEVPIKKVYSSKNIATDRTRVLETMPKLPTDPLPTLKTAGLTDGNKTVKLFYKAPVKQTNDNERDNSGPTDPNAKQQNRFLQIKDFAAFSSLKQPLSFVTGSQDLVLPPNTTLKIVYKAPSKQPTLNENDKTSSADHNGPRQLKNYPVFSTLTQPGSVSQSKYLPLPSSKAVNIVYKAPSKQEMANESDKASNQDSNAQQHNDILQFKHFPAFSPLKHPFPVVTHSQDLPLPTISTFKTPFPTTLVKSPQEVQPQNSIMETPSDFLRMNRVVTAAEETRQSHPPKSLIVLENKVLSQDEKIDLTALGLATPKKEPTPEVHLMETNEVPNTPYNESGYNEDSQASVASSSAPLKHVLADGSKLNNRTILSMDKLKLSSEKIAELVKIIKAKKEKSKLIIVQKKENTPKSCEKFADEIKDDVNTNAVAKTSKQPATTSLNDNISALSASTFEDPDIPLYSEKDFITPSRVVSTSYESKSDPLSDQESQSAAESPFKNPLPRIAQKTTGLIQFGCNKSSVCVVNSEDESDASISAVDFIASLAAEHPITEDMKLELSPEELNLNASFAMNFSPLHIPNRDRTESLKSEISEQEVSEDFNMIAADVSPGIFEPETVSDDVQIGKIITISEENILNAVSASTSSSESLSKGTQGVFKLTKSTILPDRIDEEAPVNNLDIIDTGNLVETTVGPILVKNIEIGVINKFKASPPNKVIVKNIQACFGKLNESKDIVVDKVGEMSSIVGAESVQNTKNVRSYANKFDASDSFAETSSTNAIKIIQNTVPDIKTDTTVLNDEILQSSERNSSASLEALNSNQPSSSTKFAQESKETPITENIKSKVDEIVSPKPSNQLSANEKSENNEKPLDREASNSAAPRLPRFKKGKVNLVQRKKTVVTTQEKMNAQPTKAADDQKHVQETVFKENTATTKISNQTNTNVAEEDAPSSLKKSYIEDLTHKSSPRDISKMEENSVELITQLEVIKNNENDTKEKSHGVELQPKLFDEELSKIVETSAAPVELGSDFENSETGKSADITAQIGSVSREPPLESSDLKRKTASITELLHPPKKSKRISSGTNINLTTSSIALVEKTTNNILVNVLKSAFKETELPPAKNPFKKAKIEEQLGEKSVQGIQNLLTKLARKDKELTVVENDTHPGDVERTAEGQSYKSTEEVVENKNKSAKNVDNETEPLSNLSKPEIKQNLIVPTDTGNREATEIDLASEDCDNVNMKAERQLEVNISEDVEREAKQPSDFHGFDHSSPSTQTIESNLQHILTITNSAENTKTRDENYSTAERESPHSSKNPKKPWLTTGKKTLTKSKFGHLKKSTNRRSVPLKKRWGVLRESDDDIEVTDDTSPADDEEDDDEKDYGGTRSEEANSSTNKKALENDTNQSDAEFVKPLQKQEVANDISDENELGNITKETETETVGSTASTTSLTESKKRNKSSGDSITVPMQENDAVSFPENTNVCDIDIFSKKIRLDVKCINTSIASSAENDEKETKDSTATIVTKPTHSPMKSAITTSETNDTFDTMDIVASNPCSQGSGNFQDSTDIRSHTSGELKKNKNEEHIKQPTKRGRKPKVKVECKETTEIQLAVEGTKTDTTANDNVVTSSITDSADIENQKGSNKDLIKQHEIGNTKSKGRQSFTKKLDADENNVKGSETEIDKPKTVKKRGRPKKIAHISESVDSQTSKDIAVKETHRTREHKSRLRELGVPITGIKVKEEFVQIDTELVVPSLTEMEVIQEAFEKNPQSTPKQSSDKLLKQAESKSTPTYGHTPEGGSKKPHGNRKSLGAEVVSEAESQAKTHESTPIVPKKRGRKPKSMNATFPSTIESTLYNGVAKKKADSAGEQIEQRLNDTQPESSLNATTAINSEVHVNQAMGETPIKIPKKRGRKPKALLATPETPVGEGSSNTMTKQMGRKTKVIDLETRGTFNERLLLVTKRTQLDTDEVLTAEPVASTSNTKHLVCGLCLQQMTRSTWLDHLATHYGVGWIVGETTPTNVTIRNEVLKAMAAFLKNNEGAYPLTCRMCQRNFRSALGALLHIELCGATDTRVPCDYCKREYSKLTIVSHMRECSIRMMTKKDDGDSAGDSNALKEIVFNNVGRLKRASVQKAEKILKTIGSESSSAGIFNIKDAKNYIKLIPAAPPQHLEDKWSESLALMGKANCPAPNCSFESQELTALKVHFDSCELKETTNSKGVYICQICVDSKKSYNSSKHAIKHILKHHKHTENAPDFEAEASDCGIKTDDETSGDDDDISSGVDSNGESEGSDCSNGANSSFEEGEEQKMPSKRAKKRHSVGASINAAIMERLHPPRDPNFGRTSIELWKEFTSQNYSTQPLFTDIKTVNYTNCERADYVKFLPRAERSMKFNVNPHLELTRLKSKTQYGKAAHMEWSQLQRFETYSGKNDYLTFIGEAIKIVSWVPLPEDIREQYLLITTRREYTRYKDTKVSNTLLWLYKITPAKALEPFAMQIHYAINIPDGPVHCLAFLPSGGYDESANRLGLIAVGTPSSTIKVYALPLTVEKESGNISQVPKSAEPAMQNLTTIQLQPVWLLTLELSTDNTLNTHPFLNTQCTSLCWSEFSEHSHIFAGYANGCVSYWDVSSDMNLNRFVIDNVSNFVPLNFFYTRDKNVRAMALHYDPSGVRLIALTVGRRILVVYDLEQFDRPMLIKTETARNEVMDLEWSPLWQTFAVAVSDYLSNIGMCAYAVSPKNLGFKNETIDRMNGAVTQIHYNPVQHIFATTTENGDVVLLDIREMHLKEIIRDSQRNSRAVAIMEIKSLNGENIPKFDAKSIPPDWNFFEDNYTEKYGLVFGPMTKIDKIHKPQYLCGQRRPPINLMNCTRINSLNCNTNVQGKKLIAIGYEKGFLRILNIDRKTYLQ